MTTTTPTTAAGRGKPRTAQAESADGTAEGLYRIVMSAREEETRTQVLAVLADVPGEVALGRLVAVSRRHPDADTRRMAVEVLGRRRSGEALRALEWSAFNDPSGQVQRAAVGAIAAAVDGPASLAEVRPLLERVERTHPSAPVRAHAREIMGELAERFGRR